MTTTSEDCLFLDVYAPTNATANSKLPVYLFIQGGGFNDNSNANYNGTGLIQASGGNIVVVTFNYRVGPYGFLTDGNEIEPNNGLYDQRKVFQWVQDNIALFGGVSTLHFTVAFSSNLRVSHLGNWGNSIYNFQQFIRADSNRTES